MLERISKILRTMNWIITWPCANLPAKTKSQLRDGQDMTIETYQCPFCKDTNRPRANWVYYHKQLLKHLADHHIGYYHDRKEYTPIDCACGKEFVDHAILYNHVVSLTEEEMKNHLTLALLMGRWHLTY